MEPKKTSPSIGQASLHQLLEQRSARLNRPPRIAIVGIGNLLRSDDAAGILVAKRLSQSRLTRDLESVLVIDAGHAPENRTAELRRFGPDIVLLVDAAEMGEAPGEIRWVGIEEIDGLSASTHTLPLSMLAKYLTLELACDVYLLGIQIYSNEIGETISGEVLRSIDKIVSELAHIFSSQHVPDLKSVN